MEPADFILQEYLLLNEDVALATGGNAEMARLHWENAGKEEGRFGRVPAGFDDKTYLASYADLQDAFDHLPEVLRRVSAWQHYWKFGWSEGRTLDGYFRGEDFLNLYPELAEELGKDPRQASLVWMSRFRHPQYRVVVGEEPSPGEPPTAFWTMIHVNREVPSDAHLIGDKANRRYLLIDTGSPSTAESVLIPYLEKMQIDRLEGVWITHPHFDHYGGLPNLLRSGIGIGKIYLNPVPDSWMLREWWGGTLQDLENIRNLAQEAGVPILEYKDWEKTHLSDEFVLEKVAAFSADELLALGIGPDINELSLIARLRHGNTTALLTGDLNRRLSLHLVETLGDALSSDILKVPHHGAEGLADNEFFRQVHPRHALVPGTYRQWASERSQRARMILHDLEAKAWVNGIHGHVTVHFYPGGYLISNEPP